MALKFVHRLIILLGLLCVSQNYSRAQHPNIEEQLRNGINAFQNLDMKKTLFYLSSIEDNLNDFNKEDKITLAYILGTCYYNTNNFRKSLSFYNYLLKSLPTNNELSIQIRPNLVSIYTQLGIKDTARIYLLEMEQLMNTPEFIKSEYYSDYSIALCTYYLDQKQYGKVIECAQHGIENLDSSSNSQQIKGIQKNTLYTALGNAYKELGLYNQAITNYKKALLYVSYTKYERSENLTIIGACYSRANQLDSALVYLEEAEKQYTLKNYPDNKIRVINKLEIGKLLANRGEYDNAIKFLLDAENGFKQLGEISHLLYTYSILYNTYRSIGDVSHKKQYANFIKTYITKGENVNNEDYNFFCSTYASILEEDNQKEKAIEILTEIINRLDGNHESLPETKASTISKLASIYCKSGKYLQAEKLIRTVINLLDPIKSRQKREYCNDYAILGDILINTNRVGEGIKYFENNRDFVMESNDSSIITQYFSCLSSLYGKISNYNKLLEYSILDTQYTFKREGENSYAYALSLINLAEAYAVAQQKENGKKCLEQAAFIISRLYGKKSKQYYTVLHKQMSYIITREEGQIYYAELLELSNKLFGKKSVQYGEDLCWYSTFLKYEMQDNHAIETMQKGLSILRATDTQRYLAFFLSQLSTWYHSEQDYENSYKTDYEYFELTKHYVSSNFPHLLDWQRESLWTPIYTKLNSYISAAKNANSPLYLKLAYNSLLLGKGLLLKTNNDISKTIKSSENLELLSVRKQVQIEKSKLMQATDLDASNEIQKNINRLQRIELNILDSINASSNPFEIQWSDVCDNLEDGEVAIEFTSYPTSNGNDYVALVLNNQSYEPLCIELFNDKELAQYDLNENVQYDYKNSNLYKLIWGKLERYALQKATSVYFAPDGVLHKLAIENIADTNGVTAAEKWSLHRLTSTREIITRKARDPYKSAVLYGGLKYNTPKEKLGDVVKTRAGVKELAETKDEIKKIQSLLEQQSVNCDIKIGNSGSEDSFIELSSSEINILHLATHGFFWTKENKDEYSKVYFMSFVDDTKTKESALKRSGLLLSGANTALQGKHTSIETQDGILTAQEISALDFNGLDLVVLSACQTALGEVSGEGVFGLQRGFKLAGAQSILMSLWKVDDTATKLLMIEFYRELLQGKSKTVALRNAQTKVRNTKGFEDPEFWAGFILLDALN